MLGYCKVLTKREIYEMIFISAFYEIATTALCDFSTIKFTREL